MACNTTVTGVVSAQPDEDVYSLFVPANTVELDLWLATGGDVDTLIDLHLPDGTVLLDQRFVVLGAVAPPSAQLRANPSLVNATYFIHVHRRAGVSTAGSYSLSAACVLG